MSRYFILLLWVFVWTGCAVDSEKEKAMAENSISPTQVARYVKDLASDDFQGRKPFTEGEEKTTAYLADAFRKLGIKGAFDGNYFQEVPMVKITYNPDKQLHFENPKGKLTLNYIEDYIVSTSHVTDSVSVQNSEVVFAGYGIVAPEYGWNDYKGLDVKGKTVLVLVNDPGFATQDTTLFNGNAMTYYGRWTYKYEEAARQGATGVLVVHSTDAAGYGWQVLTNTASDNLYIQQADNNRNDCAITGWITDTACKNLFTANGLDFEQARNQALKKDFQAISLNTKLNLTIRNTLEFNKSKNVVGLIEGTELKDEYVVFSAHWDHFGIGPVMDGDSIYNGAADNATALACMLETARAFSKIKNPKRSILFLACTAEETGMLGSRYFVQNSGFDSQKMVANLNYELLLPVGKYKDVTVTGLGQSELDRYVADAAQEQDRYVAPDLQPENGMYFRSDHFNFARAGVPSLFIKGWQDSREHGKKWAEERIQEYWATAYHKPDDEYNEHQDFSGIAEDAQLFFKIGYRLANEKVYPQWSEKSEFKKLRQ